MIETTDYTGAVLSAAKNLIWLATEKPTLTGSIFSMQITCKMYHKTVSLKIQNTDNRTIKDRETKGNRWSR